MGVDAVYFASTELSGLDKPYPELLSCISFKTVRFRRSGTRRSAKSCFRVSRILTLVIHLTKSGINPRNFLSSNRVSLPCRTMTISLEGII